MHCKVPKQEKRVLYVCVGDSEEEELSQLGMTQAPYIAFLQHSERRVCDGIMWRVCLHVCGSVSVCLSEREEKRMKSEQTAWWGIYVIHAQNVQCCKADSHPSPGSAVLQGLHRPDLNVKCRR